MSDKKVIIYSQPGCSACKAAKEYLSQKGIPYTDKNIREDPDAMRELIEEYKSRSTPTILIEDEVIIGFDKERLDELLT